MKIKIIFLFCIVLLQLRASEFSLKESLVRTNIAFNMDDKGNLNPSIFIPVYYGDAQEFYSSIAYLSSNRSEASSINNFSESKNALISTLKDITLNYITYRYKLFGLEASMGVESSFSQVKNSEFGYIKDSNNFFGQGTNYYISFDNSVDLSIQRHAMRAEIEVPSGKYFRSRFFVSLSPLRSIRVKQSTLFKPLVNERGVSSSTTFQDMSYILRYDGQTKLGGLFEFGLLGYYDYEPIKYNIAQLAKNKSAYTFETNTIDTIEVRTKVLAKVLLNIELFGGLNPSIGYGIENFTRKNKITAQQNNIKTRVITFSLERMF